MVIATRVCRIRKAGEEQWRPLTITVSGPVVKGPFWPSLCITYECEYFKKRQGVFYGEDLDQGLMYVPTMMFGYLGFRQDEGYEIYWREPGDLAQERFYGFPPRGLYNEWIERRNLHTLDEPT